MRCQDTEQYNHGQGLYQHTSGPFCAGMDTIPNAGPYTVPDTDPQKGPSHPEQKQDSGAVQQITKEAENSLLGHDR